MYTRVSEFIRPETFSKSTGISFIPLTLTCILSSGIIRRTTHYMVHLDVTYPHPTVVCHDHTLYPLRFLLPVSSLLYRVYLFATSVVSLPDPHDEVEVAEEPRHPLSSRILVFLSHLDLGQVHERDRQEDRGRRDLGSSRRLRPIPRISSLWHLPLLQSHGGLSSVVG